MNFRLGETWRQTVDSFLTPGQLLVRLKFWMWVGGGERQGFRLWREGCRCSSESAQLKTPVLCNSLPNIFVAFLYFDLGWDYFVSKHPDLLFHHT